MPASLRTACTAAVALTLATFGTSQVAAEPATKVFLNGTPSPVYFNDGDSFRVLGGALEGSKARLSGFNTLESYGAVHQWGTWTAHELYRNAKQGTLNARRGVWHCTSDMQRDGYGRLLWWCPDLAYDQVRKGFAHVMSVTEEPGHPKLIAAQHEAQRERRGMWAHGVPEYIVTSTHSSDEGYEGKTYNRLVSTRDGHSRKWYHNDVYKECQSVCHVAQRFDEAQIATGVAALRREVGVAAFIGRYSDRQLADLVRQRLTSTPLGGVLDEAHRPPLVAALDALAGRGDFGKVERTADSCMIYAPFNRRYGPRSAACLH